MEANSSEFSFDTVFFRRCFEFENTRTKWEPSLIYFADLLIIHKKYFVLIFNEFSG